MKESLNDLLLEKTGASKIHKTETIQSLWSGYGELNRVHLENGSVILKLIKFPNERPHPRGWSSNLGHERKKRSYQVETHWYQHFNDSIPKATIPKHVASGFLDEFQYLILEDLGAKSFITKQSLNWNEVEQCLSWMAHFHRSFLSKSPQGLWPIGTYWHLDTRPEELAAMSDHELKMAAPFIDEKLNQANYQTIVHGDAKLANFLFNGKEAAAVDFQYVGGGVGVKDLAYFLGSIYHEDELQSREEQCLNSYFNFLDLPDVEKEWRELYPFAWCDFYRFLQGWSPGHWKINSYSEQMKQKVLSCL